jgi:hypothetical protein
LFTCEINRRSQGCHDDRSARSLLSQLLQNPAEEWDEGEVVARSGNLTTEDKTLSYRTKKQLLIKQFDSKKMLTLFLIIFMLQ